MTRRDRRSCNALCQLADCFFSLWFRSRLLPFGPAHLLWMMLILGAYLLLHSSCGILRRTTRRSVSGALICFLLANSELLVIDRQCRRNCDKPCVLAVWCFLKKRFVALGVLCLAVSLALKPHDMGLVWLYFLLAGGVYRKRALQTLACICRSQFAGHSVASRTSRRIGCRNCAPTCRPSRRTAGLNDPSPASSGAHGIGMMINLQTALSFFRDDPRFYNPATYLVCGVLLLVWAFKTLRSRITPASGWLALAAIAPLTMLPVYHRQSDVLILLLLAVPACAMLWAERGLIGRLALIVTAAGFVLTGDFTWVIFHGTVGNLHA